MALGALNLKVSKKDFELKIEEIDSCMGKLDDVIRRYGDAKRDLDNFVSSNDSTYEQWCERIDKNVEACGKAKASLNETKLTLQKTVEQMEGFSSEVGETIQAATEATKQAVDAAIKIGPML